MNIVDYVYDECHRRHVTNYGDFANGWEFATELEILKSERSLGLFVQGIAREVEPDLNRYSAKSARFDNLRTSHVGFMHGGSAAPAGEVRERFDRWCEFAFNICAMPYPQMTHVDSLIKQLLDIHPFADGNGRTASILRNRMLGTLNDPTPLPFYYGSA